MNRLLLLTGFLTLAVAPPTLHAQVNDPIPAGGDVLTLEWSKPFMDGGDFGFVTSTLMAYARFPLGDRSGLVTSLGLSHGSLDGVSSTSLSNLEIGLVVESEDREALGHLSVSAPTAAEFGDDDFSVLTGAATNFERSDRYTPDLWAINAVGRRTVGTNVGGMLGASYRIPDQGDSELYVRYGVYGATEGAVRFGLELSGLGILSESDLDLGERTLHHLTASLGWPSGSSRPEAFVRVPIDGDVRDLVDVVAGLRVTF